MKMQITTNKMLAVIKIIKMKLWKNDNKNLANILQDNVVLSFENEEGMSKEENVIIEDIIEITEDILDEATMNLKKTDRNGRKVKKLEKSRNTK